MALVGKYQQAGTNSQEQLWKSEDLEIREGNFEPCFSFSFNLIQRIIFESDLLQAHGIRQ